MKRKINLLFISFLVFSSLLFTLSCSKDDDNNAKPDMKQSVSASVSIENGQSFTFSNTSFINGAAADVHDSLLIAFKDKSTKTIINFLVIPFHGAGSYSFFASSDPSNEHPYCTALMYLNDKISPSTTYLSGADIDEDGKVDGKGTLKITSLTSKHIKGTFSMTMYNFKMNKAVVSNGKFSCYILHH